MMPRRRRLLGAFGAAALPVAHFGFVYVFAALACARGFADAHLGSVGVVTAVNGAATLAALGAAFLLLLAAVSADDSDDDRDGFFRWLMGGLAAAAILSVIWNGLPVLLSPACG